MNDKTDEKVKCDATSPGQSHLVFSLDKGFEDLPKVLEALKESGILLEHLESRRAKHDASRFEFLMTYRFRNGHANDVISLLREQFGARLEFSSEDSKKDKTPWFPRTIEELEKVATNVLSYGAELDADHPGFTDASYRARRKHFEEISLNYKNGQEIPRVEYTKEEIATWKTVYNKLTEIFPTHACKEHNDVFAILKKECGYSEDNIPQLEDVSQFLQSRTGFRLRPVSGLLSPRSFLLGLAFRVFHSTQYMRHPSKPFYTPEPDICHELLGHAPMLADPSFADFLQHLGLCSFGAPDEWIDVLETCCWYTLEFGLCRQNGEIRAFGAGLLSSYGELQHSISDKAEKREFDAEKAGMEPYSITKYQSVYYVADSFADARKKIQNFCNKIPRPFEVRYNPTTKRIEVLDSKDKLHRLASKIQDDVTCLQRAMEKMQCF